MTDHIQSTSTSTTLGGEPPIFPGEEGSSKLPMPSGLSVPPELRQAWVDYMLTGFKQNEVMFKRTLDAFMKPYYLTIGMYVALFVVGIGLFVVAAILAWSNPQSYTALAFAGLGAGAFILFFIRQPLQALEENLEFITWLGVAFNTYWTRLMYLMDQQTVQADLRAAEEDYVRTVERLIDKHARLRAKRPGTNSSEANKPQTGEK
jgi:hypothetical protein